MSRGIVSYRANVRRAGCVCLALAGFAAWVSSASAIDTVTLTVQPSSTWTLTLGVLDRFATDTDSSMVQGTIVLNLDDATNPTTMSFNGQQTHLSLSDDFDFFVNLGILGGLQSQILGAAGPILSPLADGNSDGLVTGADYTIWADNFDGGTGDAKNFTQGDWNGDEHVTGADYTIWADRFGTLTGAISGGQYDLSQHLGIVNEGTSPYQGTGAIAGLSGTLDFAADPVPIQAPVGQMGSISSTPTGNPNEYLISLTVPWNIAATIDEDNGVTLDTVTMITATGLFQNTSLVPEPGSLVLLALGAAGLWGCLRRRAA